MSYFFVLSYCYVSCKFEKYFENKKHCWVVSKIIYYTGPCYFNFCYSFHSHWKIKPKWRSSRWGDMVYVSCFTDRIRNQRRDLSSSMDNNLHKIYEYFHAFIDSKKRKRWYLSCCLSFINTLTTSHCIFKENKHNNSPRSSFPPPQY